jgi:hypothetical protein
MARMEAIGSIGCTVDREGKIKINIDALMTRRSTTLKQRVMLIVVHVVSITV